MDSAGLVSIIVPVYNVRAYLREAVAFLDSDDAYHRDFVKLMMTAMEREQADIVVCRYIHVRSCCCPGIRCTGWSAGSNAE